jgi:hypothetical protein
VCELYTVDHSVSLLPRSACAWILYQRPLVIVQRSVPITIDSLRFVPLNRLVVPTIGRTHTVRLCSLSSTSNTMLTDICPPCSIVDRSYRLLSTLASLNVKHQILSRQSSTNNCAFGRLKVHWNAKTSAVLWVVVTQDSGQYCSVVLL